MCEVKYFYYLDQKKKLCQRCDCVLKEQNVTNGDICGDCQYEIMQEQNDWEYLQYLQWEYERYLADK